MIFEVRPISADETLDLRSRILRPGQSVELCRYTEDALPTTFHLGVFTDRRLVCNGSFIQQAHPRFVQAQLPYRLRGMASDPDFQKKGFGSSLISTAKRILQEKNCDLLWFNARTSAEIFYQKLDFKQIDEIFDIPQIGPHKVMYSWLK